MLDLTNSLRRQVRIITKEVKLDRPRQISLHRLLEIFAGDVEPTTKEQAYLIDRHRQHELKYDPPDCVERKLARMIAKAVGQPDPYGTDGMSEVEPRAWDWADYREKQRRHEEDRRLEALDS
jgi:hypothetical protein